MEFKYAKIETASKNADIKFNLSSDGAGICSDTAGCSIVNNVYERNIDYLNLLLASFMYLLSAFSSQVKQGCNILIHKGYSVVFLTKVCHVLQANLIN